MRLNSVLVLNVILPVAILINSSGNCSSRSSGTAAAQSKERLMLRWVRDIAALSDREAWALSEKGYVMHTTDRGVKWSYKQLKTVGRLRAIAFIDERRGFVAGNGGVLFGTTDGGQSWQPRRTNTTQTLSDLFFIGERGWAAGYPKC
jgi:photosystem II stability/assembly factor-like uncharacterized protein